MEYSSILQLVVKCTLEKKVQHNPCPLWLDPEYTRYKWSRNIDNEVVPCPITVDSHSDLLIFVSVTCMSWISLNTKYQLIGTIVLSVMYYPHVHVVNILQTFQSVIMRSRWAHHTSKYWPSSWCRGELTRKLSWAAYFANIKNHWDNCMQVHNKKKSYCMTKFIQPSQKNPNKAQKCCSYAKQYF